MSKLLATCCPGLENILAEEIAEHGASEITAVRGQVFFELDKARAFQLRCADNIYAVLGETTAARNRLELPFMCAAIAANMPFEDTARVFGIRMTSLSVSASRRGDHSYSRFDAADALNAKLSERLNVPVGKPEEAALGVRLDIDGMVARVSIKLTPATFRFRGRKEFSPASLRPTVAHALVRMSAPDAADVFLDPFCGSGTIPLERAALPHREIICGDIERAAVSIAKLNGLQAKRMDARKLKLNDRSVSAIATNPPWGMQVPADIEALHGDFLREAARVLKPGGRLVLLTPHRDTVEALAARHGFGSMTETTLSLHGAVTYALRWTLDERAGG